jgi:hypothetical protein
MEKQSYLIGENMKTIHGYPCSHCRKLTDGKILIFQSTGQTITLIRFLKECCKHEQVAYFTETDIKHYIKEV